jgi:hypothetical protein
MRRYYKDSPKSNGQVERANAEVLQGLRTTTFNRLEGCGKNWVDQVPSVLWFVQTTTTRSTGENLFSLVYRAEAVLPTELKDGSPRISTYDNHKYAEERFDDVDFLEEICSLAIVRSAHYLQGLRRYHGWHIRSRELHPGDLVLRRKQHSSDHKLSPKWEEPYRVMHVFRPGCVSL